MKIIINNEQIIEANPNETILNLALKSGITINHSCLQGRCSECKVKIDKGEYDMPNNQEGLSNNEVQIGYCLSCITKPKSDLIVSDVNYYEGILPFSRIIPSKIAEIKFLSENVAKVILRLPPNNELDYKAGQYIDISIKGIHRSYSLASDPHQKTLELLIKKYPNGKFSNYIFHEAKVDDLLRIEGPKGTYVLPNKVEENLLFLSTGTGIAPNISIINNILNNNLIKTKSIKLIHGERWAKDHIYDTRKLPITVIKATSRENIDGFYNGYVQEAAIDLDINLKKTQVFACGNPKMIFNSKKALIEKGLKESNFKSESFISTT